MLELNNSSVSYESEPDQAEPPERVVTAMMPDWALPNAADAAPVVTEASSKPATDTVFTPGLELVPAVDRDDDCAELTSLRLPAWAGTPSMYNTFSSERPPRMNSVLPLRVPVTPGCSDNTRPTRSTGRFLV